MSASTVVRTACLLLLAGALACGGEGAAADGEAADGAPASDGTVPDQAGSAGAAVSAEEGSAEATAPAQGPASLQQEDDVVPGEDVSVGWKERAKTMQSYESCMQQARQVQGATRRRLEQACGNLPTAPRRRP